MKNKKVIFCKNCGFEIPKEIITFFTEYKILPRQWYHGKGESIFLCHPCSNILDKDPKYRLESVLYEPQCYERVSNFLKKESEKYKKLST